MKWQPHRRADTSRPVSFTVSAWEWVYATNLTRLQRETSKRHVAEAHSVLTAAILLPQRLGCYWGKTVSLRMLTNLRLADLRLNTAQQRTTGQNMPCDLYLPIWAIGSSKLPVVHTAEQIAANSSCVAWGRSIIKSKRFPPLPRETELGAK
jgi:hypothetical protein